ncbi:MAG TPA: sigma-54 dependent transcriptional regulator [Thermoanaerobaculia bacterium]|nr:sigma-54 dependent transcriptional regulator [Thermoanaerobaculia bacterium]
MARRVDVRRFGVVRGGAGAVAAAPPAGDAAASPLAPWVDLLEESYLRSRVLPPEECADLLAKLARHLGAPGAALLAWDATGRPAVLAACGVPDWSRDAERLTRLVRGRDAGAGSEEALTVTAGRLVAVVLRGPGADRLALALPDIEAGEEVLAPLRLLARFFFHAHFRRQVRAMPVPPPRIEGRSDLRFPPGIVVGRSPAMQRLYGALARLVDRDLPVLVLGETGVGKEHVARLVHEWSRRRSGPFVTINCAAIPAELLEAELFGIGRGVATGVVERHGKFREAHGGTLLLDEIGELPSPLQAKLLRALEQKEVQPLGGTPFGLDVRIVAATNTDLETSMARGDFRRDLYYRLAGFVLQVPPLRQRREDLPALVDHFLKLDGSHLDGITPAALRALLEHRWQGNVRELRHELARAAVLADPGELLDVDLLPHHVVASLPPLEAGEGSEEALRLDDRVGRLEEQLIREALRRAGSKRGAAQLLGIPRARLRRRMEFHGIES